MQDIHKPGSMTEAVNRAVEQALQEMVRHLPPQEQVELLRQLRSRLGEVLSNAPATGSDSVEDVANRARLAAAFHVKIPGDED